MCSLMLVFFFSAAVYTGLFYILCRLRYRCSHVCWSIFNLFCKLRYSVCWCFNVCTCVYSYAVGEYTSAVMCANGHSHGISTT